MLFVHKQSTMSILIGVFVQRCSVKRCLQKFHKIHRKTPVLEPLFIKKEVLAQVFSCEFCKISNNNFFHRTPLVAASDSIAGNPCVKFYRILFYTEHRLLSHSLDALNIKAAVTNIRYFERCKFLRSLIHQKHF